MKNYRIHNIKNDTHQEFVDTIEKKSSLRIDAFNIVKNYGIELPVVESGNQPIDSIKTTAEFYNELRLETGYSDGENVEPLTNFADSVKPNATQGTPSKRGQYVANDINGHPAVLMDGVDDYYDTGDFYESFYRGNHGYISLFKALDGQPSESKIFFGARGSNNDHYAFIRPTGKIVIRYKNGSGTAQYESDTVIFTSGENPYKTISWFFDFDNDTPHLRVNEVDIGLTLSSGVGISSVDPTVFAGEFNPLIFAWNNQGSVQRYINVRSPVPNIAFQTLTDLKSAESELKTKYGHY